MIYRFLLVFLLSAAATFAQDTARLTEILQAHSVNHRFMGSVLVAKDGTIIFEQSTGWANAEWEIPNSAATKFRIGSVTKQFTAAAILLLAEQGKLKLDDPLSRFVPSAPAIWRPVTIRQLLNHTGGIPSFTDLPGYKAWKLSPETPAQLMAHVADLPLTNPPGEKFRYSNTGYVLLGWIVEIASGQSYEAFLREHIFQPLQMNDTGYDWNATILPSRAAGYELGAHGLEHAPYIDMHVPGGAGALYSTTEDLLRWTQGLYGGKVLSASSFDEMTKPAKEDYACGLFVSTVNGRKTITHNGGIDGFNAILTYYPESKVTVVVLSNVTNAEFTTLAEQLGVVALGDRVTLATERKEVEVPSTVLQRYVGVYRLSPTSKFTVRLTDHRLTVQLSGQEALPLFPESETKFFLKVVDAEVEFLTDHDRVTHLVLHQSGRHQKAPRISDPAIAQ